ncbi:MAG: UDP-N-acetylmuramoyl-L-alanine--D-glutamate ligase [Planctomycetota bacterium]|jgi:UDP-N-acetylmuramoylalanine--D-glutamate ligase
MKKEFFAGKKVLIMGLGRFGGGVDAAKFAAKNNAKVTVTDLAEADKLKSSLESLKDFDQIEFHLGQHQKNDFLQADIIIANPAVPPDNEFLKIAAKANKLITSQMNIFFELSPATIIGITGSNGKSTTAALTAHLLKSGTGQKDFKYSNVWLSGNIGNQPLLDSLDEIGNNDLVVLEISSFQTEKLPEIQKAPKVSVITNLTPNHLDRHGTFENYCTAKENIFKLQKPDENSPAVSIFNAQDKFCCEWFEKYKKDSGRTCLQFSPYDVPADLRDSFSLAGETNLANLAAAMAVAKHFGIKNEWIKHCLGDFKPLPHRLELIAEINGAAWYNDSIATTPASTIAAIEAFDEPKIIIAGGYDKKLPFEELAEKIATNVKAAILIGQTAEKIAEAIKAHPENKCRIEMADSLEKAVELADKLTANGYVVLLSPACASYDMFDNFQQRGQRFVELVGNLRAIQ